MKDRIAFYLLFFDEIIKKAENSDNNFGYINQASYPDIPFSLLPVATQQILDMKPIYVNNAISNDESFIRTPNCILQIKRNVFYTRHISSTQYKLHISHKLDDFFALPAQLIVNISEDGLCNAFYDWCRLGSLKEGLGILSQVIIKTIPELEKNWDELGMLPISCKHMDAEKHREFLIKYRAWLEERKKFGQEQALLKKNKKVKAPETNN